MSQGSITRSRRKEDDHMDDLDLNDVIQTLHEEEKLEKEQERAELEQLQKQKQPIAADLPQPDVVSRSPARTSLHDDASNPYLLVMPDEVAAEHMAQRAKAKELAEAAAQAQALAAA